MKFSEFLAEKSMHSRAFSASIGRVGKSAKIGFEIEIFVQPVEDEEQPGVEDVSQYNSIQEFENTFIIQRQVKAQIDREYAAWVTLEQDEWVDDNWEMFADEDEMEENSARAEKNARRAAQRHAPAAKGFHKWLESEFKSPKEFISHFGIEPKHGWIDGDTVRTKRDRSSEQDTGWASAARSVATKLEKIVGSKVSINAPSAGYTSWNIVKDTSIKNADGVDFESGMGGHGIEIVSPPLPFVSAFDILDKIMHLIRDNGYETNESTGIHMNISLEDMSNFDPLKLVLFMGDKHVLAKFNRLANAFSRSQFQQAVDGVHLDGQLPTSATDIETAAKAALKSSGKYFSVNLQHLPHYIEFRAAGGAGYHERIEDLHELMGRWLTAMEIAADPNKDRREYLKKIAKLTSTQAELDQMKAVHKKPKTQ